MTQVTTDSHARPTIGDILLAHGFVSREDLAAAIEEQQRSEQPLGQILVTRGSITRLELASALAEQWSMAPAPERPGMDGSGRPSVVIDDDTYAVRVQSAVSELARRVGAAEPLLAEIERRAADFVSPQELEARLGEVRASIDLSLGRIEALESGVSTIAERLEEMTDGVEQAFADMQAGTAELADRLSAVATSLAERPGVEELSALSAVVASLEAGPQVDPTLPGRVGEISAQLEAGLAAIDELHAGLGARESSAASAEAAATSRLDELEQRIESLAAGVANDDRAAHVEEQLAELAVGVEQRLAGLPDVDAIETLRAELHELSQRPVTDPQLGERFEERLLELEQRIEQARDAASADLKAELHSLSSRVAEVADDTSIGELEARMAELSDRPVSDPTLAARLDELAAELDRLGSIPPPETMPDPQVEALADAVEGLRSQLESMATLVGNGEQGPEIEELRAALDELGMRRTGDEQTAQRLDTLAAEIAELAARPADTDDLAARVDELAAELDRLGSIPPPETMPDPQVEALADAVEGLRSQLESMATLVGNGEQGPEIEELRAALDELGMRRTGDEQTAQRLDTLAAEIAELAARPADTDDLAARVDELGGVVGTAATAADMAALRAELEELAVDPATSHLEERLVELTQRLEGLEAAPTDAALERLHEDVEQGLRDAFAAADRTAETLSLEIGRLSARLDELAGAGESAAPAEASASSARTDAATERELERQRMAIERLGLHLGEHERALAEMMRTRGLNERLEELAARIEELAAAGAGSGAAPAGATNGAVSSELHAELRALVHRFDEAEATAQADREKQLTRLDRMASSIDWRLQRLEAGGDQEN